MFKLDTDKIECIRTHKTYYIFSSCLDFSIRFTVETNVEIIPRLIIAFGFSVNYKVYASIAIKSFLNASIYINWETR